MSEVKPVSEAEIKEMAGKFTRYCPKLWRAISAKRYLLPNYRQADYYSQPLLDAIFFVFLSTYYDQCYGPVPDAVIRAVYLANVMALQEARPIYFLERELGEALLRTQLPMDLCTDDIKWRRRQMRIMLPRGLISLERDGATRSAMHLDIAQAKAEEYLRLPDEMVQELRILGLVTGRLSDPDAEIKIPYFSRSGMVTVSQLDKNAKGSVLGEQYSAIRPFEGLKLSQIKVGGHFDTGAVMDESDDALLARLEHLALNVLLFMGSMPLEYQVTSASDSPVRKIQTVNDRLIPGLYPAHFVGRSQYRPSAKPPPVLRHSGRTMPAHWKAGAWRRQHFGPGNQETKLIWIEPYAIGELRAALPHAQ